MAEWHHGLLNGRPFRSRVRVTLPQPAAGHLSHRAVQPRRDRGAARPGCSSPQLHYTPPCAPKRQSCVPPFEVASTTRRRTFLFPHVHARCASRGRLRRPLAAADSARVPAGVGGGAAHGGGLALRTVLRLRPVLRRHTHALLPAGRGHMPACTLACHQ
eukprot:2587241-Pleurochrysis_carterae.AAC.2